MEDKFDENKQKAVFVDDKTQKELNAPLSDPTGVDPADQEFLEMVVKMIDEGVIDLYKPDSLINHEFYDTLSEDRQGKADLEAVNLLSALRDIKGLYDGGFKDTFQIQNLVHRVRNTKERLEEEGGDMFII